MQFKFTAIVHHNTSIIKITEQIEAKDKEDAQFLIKALHAENLVEVISLDTCTQTNQNKQEGKFVHHSKGLEGSFSPPPLG